MKAALVILDGWGTGDHDRRDAIREASTPTIDGLDREGISGYLDPSGRKVGLPEGTAGNSEVGHLHIGAGRIVDQAYTRINDSIAAGSFADNDVLAGAFDHVDELDSRLHFIGLLSKGGVHADHRHLHTLIRWAADRALDASSHIFTDGRDMGPHSGRELLTRLVEVIEAAGTGHIASVSGRYYGMDRDENWERTKRVYDLIVAGKAAHTASSPLEAIDLAYSRGESDEFVEPTRIEGRPTIGDDDAIIFINFRGDRARQLTRLVRNIDPTWPFETDPPNVRLVTMTEYDRTFDLPVAFSPPVIENTIGEVIADEGLSQLRLAESEKYAHVTYFLNGGREIEFDGEIREIIQSPSVPTYDLRPEMSADEVTTAAISIIDRTDPDVAFINYANPDMVGHTGDFDATITAVETVDDCVSRLVDRLRALDAHIIITADHGNADDMGTAADPHTAHTDNPVPFIHILPGTSEHGGSICEGRELRDIAPTLLDLLGIDIPAEMTGRPITAVNRNP